MSQHDNAYRKMTTQQPSLFDFAFSIGTYVASSPNWLLNDPAVSDVQLVTTAQIQIGSVYAYYAHGLSDVFHMVFIVRGCNEAMASMENCPDVDQLLVEGVHVPPTGTDLYRIVFKSESILPGIPERYNTFRSQFGPWHPVTNNCEHFINYLITGRHESFTVNRLLHGVTHVKNKLTQHDQPSIPVCICNNPQYNQRETVCNRCHVKFVDRIRIMCPIPGHSTLFEPSLHECQK